MYRCMEHKLIQQNRDHTPGLIYVNDCFKTQKKKEKRGKKQCRSPISTKPPHSASLNMTDSWPHLCNECCMP
eukprot:c8075_g2_i1 orf=224-439(+)